MCVGCFCVGGGGLRKSNVLSLYEPGATLGECGIQGSRDSDPLLFFLKVEQLTAAGSKTADYIRNIQQQLEQAKAAAAAATPGGRGANGVARPSTPEGSPTALHHPASGGGGGEGEEGSSGGRRMESMQRELQTTKEEAARMASELQAQVWGDSSSRGRTADVFVH